MSERDEKRGGSGVAIGCLLMLLFVPLLYVLSVGPAVWLVEHYPATEYAINILYTPLSLVAESFSPVKAFFEWYIDFWQ
jgi:hypothetical protein